MSDSDLFVRGVEYRRMLYRCPECGYELERHGAVTHDFDFLLFEKDGERIGTGDICLVCLVKAIQGLGIPEMEKVEELDG